MSRELRVQTWRQCCGHLTEAWEKPPAQLILACGQTGPALGLLDGLESHEAGGQIRAVRMMAGGRLGPRARNDGLAQDRELVWTHGMSIEMAWEYARYLAGSVLETRRSHFLLAFSLHIAWASSPSIAERQQWPVLWCVWTAYRARTMAGSSTPLGCLAVMCS